MKGIILAAGRGSRMGERGQQAPKALQLLSGQPLLFWQLKALEEGRIEKRAIVTGYLSERFVFPSLTHFKNEAWETTNMVSSLMRAAVWLRDDDTIVSYSDIVYPGSTIRTLAQSEGDIVVPFNTEWRELWQQRFSDPLLDAETFSYNPDGTLTQIGGRARSLDEIQGQYMGLLKLTPAGWGRVESYLTSLPESTVSKLDVTSLLQRLLSRKVAIQTVPIAGQWYEVDSERDLMLYERLIGEGKSWMSGR